MGNGFDQEDPFKKYGGQEVLDKEDPFQKYGGSLVPSKKKGLLGGVAEIGASVSSGLGSDEKKILTDYLYSIKPHSEKEQAIPLKENTLVNAPVKKQERSFDLKLDEKSVAGGYNKINEIMYDEGDKWKDPVKELQSQKPQTQQEFNDLNAAAYLTRQSLLPSGSKAKEVLSTTHFKNAGEDNQTANMLRDRVAQYDKVAQPFRDFKFYSGDQVTDEPTNDYTAKDRLYNTAIQAYANKNPAFKNQLQAAGIDLNSDALLHSLGDNNAKRGQIMADILSDPDFSDFIKNERPNLFPAVKEISDNLIYDNKDYGKVQIANEISRDMQKGGYNAIDPVFNFSKNAKAAGDATAQKLYASDPKKLQLYEENKGEVLDMLDTPSFFEGFASEGKEFGKGIVNTFTEPFTPISETMKNNWEKEASSVNADPQGAMKYIRDVGHATGLVSSIMATGNVLGIANPKTAGSVATGLGFFGDELEKGKVKYPDRPFTAWSSAVLNTGMYVALSYDLLPKTKAIQAFEKVKPELSNIVENLTAKKITLEAARKEGATAVKQALDFAGGSLSKSAKISLELGGVAAVDKAFDKIAGLDDETFEKYHPDDEIAKTLKSSFFTFLPITAIGKLGEMKRGNKIVEESLYEAATNPKRYDRVIDELEIKDPSVNTQELRDNLKFLIDTKAELDARGVDPKNQKRFLFEAMNTKVKSEALSKVPDANIIRKGAEEIRGHQEISERILNGEDVVGEQAIKTPEQELIQKALANNEIQGMYKNMAEEAVKTPEGAKQLLEDANSQINNKVEGELGDSGEAARNTFGKTISDHLTEPPAAESTMPQEKSVKAKIAEVEAKHLEAWQNRAEAEAKSQKNAYKKYDDLVKQYDVELAGLKKQPASTMPVEGKENAPEAVAPKEGMSQRLERMAAETKSKDKNNLEAQRKADVLINGTHPEFKEFAEKYNGWILGENKKPEINTAEEGKIGKILRLVYSDLSDKEMKEELKQYAKAYDFYGSSLPSAKSIKKEVVNEKQLPQSKITSNETILPEDKADKQSNLPPEDTKQPEGTPPEAGGETAGGEGGQVPPNEPPPAKPEAGGRKGRLNDKGILNHLYEATNVPEAAKEGFKQEGLRYNTKSQKEAQDVAKSVIEFAGMDEALSMAESQKFDGDVNSMIFAESLNKLAEQSDKAATPEEKAELDKRFAEVGIAYDKAARSGGRFNAAINHFYKKSPLGIVMIENEKRQQDFTDWSKPKDKSWKEFFTDLMKEPEFKEAVGEHIKGLPKEEAAAKRQQKRKNISDAFDKAKFKGDSLKSAVIPPQIWNGAVEVMKQTFLAGESLVDTIQKGIDYIKANHKEKFDEDKYWIEWTERLMELEGDQPKSKLTKFKEGLAKQIADLNEQIKNKQRKPKGEKVELDEEAKKLIEERDELKKKLEEVAPMSEANWYENRLKVLDSVRKKLKGLTDKEKDEVIRKSYRQLVENGALEYQDFRRIIGEVTGRATLTPEQAERLKELVKITNSVEDAAQKARQERTPEALANFRKAEIEAGKAAKELQDMFNNKPDIVKRLTSIMQLNTLGIASLVNNPIYNIWNQATLRFPIGFVNSAIDMFGKRTEQEYNIVQSQLEFWNKLGLGTQESFKQLFTGLNRMDYIQKEVQGQRIRPIQSWRDLFNKKKKLSGTQKFDKILQGTVGIPAEAVARVLNLGDKPQRFAAEGSQAAAFAKALGLKDMDYKLFIEFPREESYNAYKALGYSDAEASQKADYVKEAIIKEGQRSTFQQDNLFNDAVTRFFSVFGGKDSGTSNLLKTLAVSPYIKIPSNAFWSFYNLLNPEVALLQSMVHKGRSVSYEGKGEHVKQKMQNREARYWLAHAFVGMATRAVVLGLLGKGIITPNSDSDDSKKERDATSLYSKTGSIKIGDMDVSLRWFGQPGMLLNSMAKKYQDQTQEQRDNQYDFWNIAFGGMEREGLKEAQNGLLANSSSLIQSIDSGNFDKYVTNTVNMFANIIQPASIAQFNRANINEVPTSRGDNLLSKIDQQFAQRSPLYRAITGTHIDKKLDIWGQQIPKGGNVLSRMFGISKADTKQFGRPIYEDAVRTGDSGFLPPSVLPTLNNKKLKEAQYEDLQNRIGTDRKNLVGPYVNDMATIEGYNVTYSQLTDADRKFVLNYLYDEGRRLGLEKFYEDYPELKPKKEEIDYNQQVKEEIFKILSKYKK